jgi:glutamine synthetase type III
MAAPSLATPALGCMQEIQRQCFLLGIPLKTRHREVAPNQFEFAPLYGFVTTQIDQNLMVMQIIEETAASFGLAALFQEKPFQVRATGAMSCCWSPHSCKLDVKTALMQAEPYLKNSLPYCWS